VLRRGFAAGVTKDSFVSGVERRMFNRRLSGRVFDTSGGRSRCSWVTLPSSLRDVIWPRDRIDEDVDGFGKRRPVLYTVIADQAKDSALGEKPSMQ
jgi:hypothetical protein